MVKPLFATISLVQAFVRKTVPVNARLGLWGPTAGVVLGWMVYPALTDNFKAGLTGGKKDEE